MSSITDTELSKKASDPPVESTLHDDRLDHINDSSSSSLSEPDDRTGNEDGNDGQGGDQDGVDGYDTEAETERLEKTPRRQRNVFLAPLNGNLADREGSAADEEQREGSPNDPQEATDSSLEETGGEEEASFNSSSSKKRKRSQFDPTNIKDQELERHAKAKAFNPSRSPSPDESTSSPTPVAEEEDHGNEPSVSRPVTKQSHRKGKRKGKKIKEDEGPSKGESTPQPGSLREVADHAEAASSNGEEVEMDDTVERDGVDVDGAAKTEEDLFKKKTAMDALSNIENCFATLRDKLFDERLAQCNEELAMLEQPGFIHPELLLMKEVIDRRRNQKIKYEQTLLKYKLESLQRESIANKAQMHSQYMQTVGELRDTSLAQINAEIYQTQRERRSCEADMPDYMYAFSTKRSKQVTEQTAYNEEVSLLSGVAKYVGFPAAPDVATARSNEWEEDERTYRQNVAAEDEASNARKALRQHPPMLRASLSAASTFPRVQPAAENQFMQQNAWANPQHPAHQKHRQVSTLSRAATPSATPTQKRAVELNYPHGSASTIPEHPSAPNSSTAPTPATGEVNKIPHTALISAVPQTAADATPSRITGLLMDETPAMPQRLADHSHPATSSQAETNPAPLVSKIPGRESHTPSTLPKPLPFMQSGGTSRASPPVRHPVIKAEDPSIISRHSPKVHQFSASPPISTTTNGQMTRFSNSIS